MNFLKSFSYFGEDKDSKKLTSVVIVTGVSRTTIWKQRGTQLFGFLEGSIE